MCGRFTLTVESKILYAAFHLTEDIFDHRPRYNIAPTQQIPVVARGSHGREISYMTWGLIPPWAKDPKMGRKMINARAETIDSKPSFKFAYQHRRCLIPADGYYEWKKVGQHKQPMRIVLPGKPIFAFAGIWEQWQSPEGHRVHSCSVITTAANEKMLAIHDRMPALLTGEEQYRTWLESDEPLVLKELLQPCGEQLIAYPVSAQVNSPKLDIPQLVVEVKEEKRQQHP